MKKAIPLYRERESPLIYVISAGLVAGLLIGGGKAIAPQIEACSRLEKATLVADRISTNNATYELGDLTDHVFSYKLPLFMDEKDNTLYSLGSCP